MQWSAHESSSSTYVSAKRVTTTKTFVDCKRKELQKNLKKEGRQDLVMQNSQKQFELQQTMIEVLQKKDNTLDSAFKSIAESTVKLNDTLAATMQYMITMGQQPGPVFQAQHQHVPQGNLFAYISYSKWPALKSCWLLF